MAPNTSKPKAKRPLDPAWEHCVQVIPNDDHHVKCNYCFTTMYGGINRLKHHLARVVCKDVVVCDRCPPEITTQMIASLHAIKEQNAKSARMKCEVSETGRSQMAPPDPSKSNSSLSAYGKQEYNLSFLPSSYNSSILSQAWRVLMKRRGRMQIWQWGDFGTIIAFHLTRQSPIFINPR